MLASYPDEFLEAAQMVIERLRDEQRVTHARAIHAIWHLAGYALHLIGKDETSTERIPWFFGDSTMPVPAGWTPPRRAKATLADLLEEKVVEARNDELKTGAFWLTVLKLLAEILFVLIIKEE